MQLISYKFQIKWKNHSWHWTKGWKWCPDLSNMIFCIASKCSGMQCDYCSLCVLSCWSATGTFARTQHLRPFILKNQASDGARFSQRIILLAISARTKRSIFGKTGHQLTTVRTFNGPTLVPGFLMNLNSLVIMVGVWCLPFFHLRWLGKVW